MTDTTKMCKNESKDLSAKADPVAYFQYFYETAKELRQMASSLGTDGQFMMYLFNTCAVAAQSHRIERGYLRGATRGKNIKR